MFYIKDKKEFIITYASDFGSQLLLEDLWDWWISNYGNQFEIILSKETGDKNNNHDHYHLYLNYIGKNEKGFSTRRTKVWDVPLKRNVVKIYNFEEPNIKEDFIYEWEETLLNIGRSISGTPWTKINNAITATYGFAEFKIINLAHPNIKFKGCKDKEWDEYCKNSYNMIKYVTKAPIEPIMTNFDWEGRLKELENQQLKRNKKLTKKDKKTGEEEETKDSLEYDFCKWVFDLINSNKNLTYYDVKRMIFKNDDLHYIYASKYHNYDAYIRDCFKNKKISKPKEHWDWKWSIPKILADYLKELDKWVENWYTDRNKCQHRMKGLWLTGDSRSGKSSLIILQGPCSWFKNMWNAMAYEGEAAFNVIDDFDVEFDTMSSFTLYKPWVGAQDCLTMTDKWVKKLDIENGKPLIWINNNPLEEQVPNKRVRDYIKKNMIICQLGEYDLYNEKDRRSIGGFCQWVDWDPKSTWYYQNLVKKPEETASENEQEDVRLIEGRQSEIVIEIDGTEEPPEKRRRINQENPEND